MELSNFDFHKELGMLRDEISNFYLKKGESNQRFANGDNKLCIPQEKRIEWLTKIHKQRDPLISMDEMTFQVTKIPY